MNVYDFDKTLYPKESTLEFYLVSLLRHPSFLLDLPGGLLAYIRYKRGKIPTEVLRERFFRSFCRLKHPEREAERFWAKRKHKLFSYYVAQRRPDDVVISASPEFVLRPIARAADFGTLIASRYNLQTARYDGLRCYGEEKPKRFFEHFPDAKIEEFYSDSLSDTPMARLAERAYLVDRRGRLTPWPKETL
jgi:hypothetical protein